MCAEQNGPYLYYIPKRGYLNLSLVPARVAFSYDVGIFRYRSHAHMDVAIRSGQIRLHNTLKLSSNYFVCWQVIQLDASSPPD